MYWFYTYKWRRDGRDTWKHSMDVFSGSFTDMILNIAKQPEEWALLHYREITVDEYAALVGEIG